jgi:hypothetical protein
MAVIKIVPMPGAVGDKGDEGAVGPRGQQGETGLQGPAGADALWSYNGEYNPGAGYAVGDVVTFDGQLWYRKNSNGGNVGDTPSEGLFWDLLAAKGADLDSTNGLVVTGYIDDLAVNPAGTMSLSVSPGYTALVDLVAEDATFNGSLYVSGFFPNRTTIIETPTTINNDLTVTGTVSMPSLISSGTWDTNIKAQSNISGGVSVGLENPGFGSYYCIGDLVTFEFRYNLGDVPIGGGSYSPITFNPSADSGFSFKLPFPIREPYQGAVASNGYHYAANEYVFAGNFFGRVDSSLPTGSFNMPDEEGWINVNGIGFTDETDPNNRQSFVIFDALADAESINTNVKTTRRMTHQWPFDFSGTPSPNHHFFDIKISGTYIRA